MYFHINFTSSIVKIISNETARYSIGVMSGFLPPWGVLQLPGTTLDVANLLMQNHVIENFMVSGWDEMTPAGEVLCCVLCVGVELKLTI